MKTFDIKAKAVNNAHAVGLLGRAAISALFFRSGLVLIQAVLPAVRGVPKATDARRYDEMKS